MPRQYNGCAGQASRLRKQGSGVQRNPRLRAARLSSDAEDDADRQRYRKSRMN